VAASASGKPLNILVTGGAGFIGSNLIPELLKVAGRRIVVLDNESNGHLKDLDGLRVECIRGELLDRSTLEKAIAGVDTIVHLAADTRVMDSIVDPRKNFDANVVGTFLLLEIARKMGVRRIVAASTGGAILGEAPAPIHEDMVARPLSPYGASKLAMEGYLSAFGGAYGMVTTALRFSNVFGPKSYLKGSVVAHFFKALLAGKPLVVYGDGSQIRDYVYVGDLVRGISRAIDVEVAGAIQLGSGRPTTLNQLIETMKQAVGPSVRVEVQYEPRRAGEIHTTWCEIAHARKTLGYDPSTSLADGLVATWKWFKQNQTS
jgi:UDP-glucose 4-epimerase